MGIRELLYTRIIQAKDPTICRCEYRRSAGTKKGELLTGPRYTASCWGDTCGRNHWGFRWSSLWGNET
eukprot:6834298-Pyramimonas_sp.AAC.1